MRACVLLWVTIAGLRAQDPVDVARVHALGGDCHRILIAEDQRHALTVGEYGDLCWWDLERVEVLLHVTPRERFMSAVALHPKLPLAAVCWSKGGHGDGAPVCRVDLIDGAVETWIPGHFTALAFDAEGAQLAAQRRLDDLGACEHLVFAIDDLPIQNLDAAAWRREARHSHALRWTDDGRCEGDPAASYFQPKQARSPDGVHSASFAKRDFAEQLLRLDDVTYEPPCAETWLAHLRVTDSGLAIAADQQGQLHFVRAGEPIVTRAPHRGAALRLTFSPDGRHLAVQSAGALRIVDLRGREELALDGPHIVRPGEAGGEFHLFDRLHAWRFDSSSRRDVGEAVHWAATPLPMLCGAARTLYTHRFGDAHAPIWIPGAATRIAGAPWISRDRLPNAIVRWTGAGFAETPTPGCNTTLLLEPIDDARQVLLVGMAVDVTNDTVATRLFRFDTDGAERERSTLPGRADWCCLDGEGRRLWICFGRRLHTCDARDFAAPSVHELERHLLDAALLPDGALLASDGEGLLVLDPDDLSVRHRWPNPAGMPHAGVLAVSPDDRHAAVACHDEVRLLRLP